MRTFLALILLSCAVAWAQSDPNSDSASDLDWQAEIDLANRFSSAGDYPGAYLHSKKSLEIAQRKHLGPRFVAGSEWGMAEALRSQRKLPEAEALHRDSLRLRESVLPPTHYRVLQSVYGLALTLHAERKEEEAEPLFVRVIAGYNQISERDGPDECLFGSSLANLGLIRLRQQQYDQAEGLMLRAIKSWRVIGPECGEMHGVWDTLSALYTLRGQQEKIEPLFQEAIRDLTPEEGERPDPHYAHYIVQLGALYVAQKRYAEAEPLLKQGIALLEQDPLADKGGMEGAVWNYIALLKGTQRLDEIPPLERRLDALHRTTAATAQSPAEQWDAIGVLAAQAVNDKKWAEAEKLSLDALALNDSLSKEDPRRVRSYLNLSGVYQLQTRVKDAETALEQGIAAMEKAGIRSPDALNLYDTLANLKMMANDAEGAESGFRRAVTLREKWALPTEASELSSLSAALRMRGRNEASVEVALRAVRVSEAEYGLDAMALTPRLEALGLSYEAAKQFDEAERVYKRVLAIEEKQFGPSHPVLGGPLSHLLSVYRQAGRIEEARQVELRMRALSNQAR
jgi:tetratricopeptide (TPR) repeat protein